MTSKPSETRAESGLALLRAAALIALSTGAVGSLGMMLREGRNTPRFLLVLFVGWILSPFIALLWANVVSGRWPALVRTTLYCATLAIAVGSLAIYGKLVARPAGSAQAFWFVLGPAASLVLAATTVGIAALVSRRPSRSN